MSGFIFVPIVRVRNVGFLAIVRNVVCTNCRGAVFSAAKMNMLSENGRFITEAREINFIDIKRASIC